jgi:uncharacterized protein YggU (UPF0235/DUF167 family)
MLPKPREFKFKSGQGGAALAIRVTSGAISNKVEKILDDGTIKFKLESQFSEDCVNQTLLKYLAEILDVGESDLEIVAGWEGLNKLVSVYGLDAEIVSRKILKEYYINTFAKIIQVHIE